MKIAFIGIGNVGFALADQLQKVGHEIVIAARDPNAESVKRATTENPYIQVAAIPVALARVEVVFLATPFGKNAEALRSVAPELSGKVLVDCTNPVGPGLTHGLSSQTSGSEQVQQLAPTARVVKAFTIYGYENLRDNRYPGYGNLRPVMPIAGDDADAKRTVASLVRELGWEPLDTGPLSVSLQLEHMTLLWVKMARAQGLGPNFTWAMLRR